MKFLTSTVGFSAVVSSLVLALSACSRAATEPAPAAAGELRIEPDRHYALLVDMDGEKALRVNVRLINEDDREHRVLTKNLPYGSTEDARGIIVNFSVTHGRSGDDYRFVESIYPYAPVTLRPGEAVELFQTFSNSIIDELESGDNILVMYRIGKNWGQRFGLWHGHLMTEMEVVDAESVMD